MDIINIPDDKDFSPQELAILVNVRIETIYRWLKHPISSLPHTFVTEGFNKKYFIKGKDIKEYFKLREDLMMEEQGENI